MRASGGQESSRQISVASAFQKSCESN